MTKHKTNKGWPIMFMYVYKYIYCIHVYGHMYELSTST